MIKFQTENHRYTSLSEDGREWRSITQVIHSLSQPFDPDIQAPKSSVRKPGKWPNKWYGVPIDEIKKAWKDEADRSVGLGNYWHNKKEQELYTDDAILMWNVVKPIVREGIKYAPKQELSNLLVNGMGVFPEHMIYLESAGLCGQVDRVNIIDGLLTIGDYKTCKEIKKESFTNWEGPKMMLPPVQHLQDSNYWHYALQLSMYAYIILRHNPSLNLGALTVYHILFEIDHLDKYEYPVYKLDENKEPIVKDVVPYNVPFLKKECIAILERLKTKQV